MQFSKIPNVTLIAEVKTQSPFGFVSTKGRLCLFDELEPIADILSIHTSPLWGGSFEWLKEARKRTNKPILAKGFHPTIFDVKQALDCGANYVLTVGWWPEGYAECIHECETLGQLSSSKAPKALWNARNPRTGERRMATIEQARQVRNGWLCQASMIQSSEDVATGVQAILVGQFLCK